MLSQFQTLRTGGSGSTAEHDKIVVTQLRAIHRALRSSLPDAHPFTDYAGRERDVEAEVNKITKFIKPSEKDDPRWELLKVPGAAVCTLYEPHTCMETRAPDSTDDPMTSSERQGGVSYKALYSSRDLAVQPMIQRYWQLHHTASRPVRYGELWNELKYYDKDVSGFAAFFRASSGCLPRIAILFMVWHEKKFAT